MRDEFLKPTSSHVCVVYLARAQNGLKPFETFLESYARCPGGLAHDFLIVFKGFKNPQDAQPYLARAQGWSPLTFFMNDWGFDLRGYGLAFRHFNHPFFCCLNSYSELLHPEWLSKLYGGITQPGVGLAGATASYESMYDNVRREREQAVGLPFLARLKLAARATACRVAFDPFPNAHLRSTGFIIGRELAREVWPRHFPTKRSAYLFENGKNGLTKRILRAGLRPVVVGKEGIFEKEQWGQSQTFRQGNQDNLLISDNQTRLYDAASPEMKKRLESLAWRNSSRC